MPARVGLSMGEPARVCVCGERGAFSQARVARVRVGRALKNARVCVREHMRTHPAAPFRDGTGRCGQAHLGPARARRPDSTGPG